MFCVCNEAGPIRTVCEYHDEEWGDLYLGLKRNDGMSIVEKEFYFFDIVPVALINQDEWWKQRGDPLIGLWKSLAQAS